MGIDNVPMEHLYEFEWETCDWYVSKTTKHCKVCNRCTKDFDHHCIWLNNCIGYNNYTSFIILLVAYWAYNWLYLIVGGFSIFSMIRHFSIKKGISVGLLAVCGLTLIVKVVITALTTSLLIFHILLKCKGQTTYEFIVKRRELKRCILFLV